MGELESHYKRLCRLGHGNKWKRTFLGVAVLLCGGVLGAILAGPGWTWRVKVAAVLAVVCALAWRGIAETESEDIKNLCKDYKEDILDSIELVPVEEEQEGNG
jgi:membrane protein implicated in regulation of membrane protease activity